jgi:hypothetical protein
MAKRRHPRKWKPSIPGDQSYIDEAMRNYGRKLSDDFELDKDISISRSDDGSGAWIRSWVWVYADDARKSPETLLKRGR